MTSTRLQTPPQARKEPPAPGPTTSASRRDLKGLGFEDAESALAPPPPAAPPPGAAIQRQQSPTRSQPRAIQRKSKTKVEAKVGLDAGFDTELTIPLWGPVSFKGKVIGSFTQNRVAGGTPNSEVEVSVFGGLHANLVFATLTVGVRGRIKASVKPTSDPIVALKQGLGEVMRWEVARDFAKKVVEGRKRIQAAAIKAKAAVAEIIATATKNKFLADLALNTHVTGYASELQSALSAIGAKSIDQKALFKKVSDAAAPVFKLQDMTEANQRDPAKTIALRLAAISRLGQSIAAMIDGSRANVEALFDKAVAPGNNPSIGFEAALSFEIGATVAATQNLGVEVQLIQTAGVEDKAGAKSWDHKVSKSKAIAASFTLGGFQVTLGGSMKDDDEVEVTVGVARKKTAIKGDPQLTAQEVASFAKHAFHLGRLRELFGGSRTSALKSAAQGLSSLLQKHLQAEPSPQGQGEHSASVELKAKGSIKQNKMLGGSVKVTPNSTQVGGTTAFKKLGVSGSVRSGQFFEVSIEFG